MVRGVCRISYVFGIGGGGQEALLFISAFAPGIISHGADDDSTAFQSGPIGSLRRARRRAITQNRSQHTVHNSNCRALILGTSKQSSIAVPGQTGAQGKIARV